MAAGQQAAVGFVGRSAELQLIDRALHAASEGVGSLVLVTGVAGIGKSWFCREVIKRARVRDFRTAWGGCWPEGGAPPLWPWQAILDDLIGDGAAQLLLHDRGAALDPERFTRFVAIRGRIAESCAQRPAVVVIDDLQDADPDAAMLVRFIGRHLSAIPLVLVLSCRSGEVSGLDPRTSVAELAAPIELRGFDRVETAEFLRVSGQLQIDDDMVAVLMRLTAGHPLHLRRIAALGKPSVEDDLINSSLGAAIAQGIDRLSTPFQRYLGQSAVLGKAPAVREAAAAAKVTPKTLQRAIAAAVPLGLVTTRVDRSFSFSHELIRAAFEARLTTAERETAHARAAGFLAPSTRDETAAWQQLARYAHHCLAAARRSDDDARAAVEASRIAARAMTAGFAYEQAAGLLAAGAAAYEQTFSGTPPAVLLVEWAEAVLRCGRLAEARALFDRAVSVTEAEQDVPLLARATLGLGGVWVNEHRTQVEWERVSGLQRRALVGLPAEEVSLRHRLVVRLAVEGIYRGTGTVDVALRALADTRRAGDRKALAEALSLCHHGLLTATHTWIRLPLAEELIAIAATAGEGLLALMGLCWRTVDLFHLGDARATRSLAELRERAETLGCLSVLYIAENMEIMLLIRAGSFDEAEARARSSLDLGTRVGDADAFAYFGTHISTIRWLQGRESEVTATIHQLIDSPLLNPAEFAFSAAAAHLDARAGKRDRAREILERLDKVGIEQLPDSSTWLAGMSKIAETANVLGSASLAHRVYRLLLPYAELTILPSLAVTCMGSVHRPLGIAALTFDDIDLGITHLERAVAANHLLGNRPFTALAMSDLATAFLRRSRGHDQVRARELMMAARDAATSMGMRGYAADWSRSVADLVERVGTIDRNGHQWEITLEGRRVIVADRLGIRYIAQLLANPGQSIPSMELASGPGGPVLVPETAQPVLDSTAKSAYRQRVTDLTAEIEHAEDRDDLARAERAREELQEIFAELRRATGHSQRSRTFIDSHERARTAVRKAIKRTLDEITTADPMLGQDLSTTIITGATCCYVPDADRPIRWTSTTQ